MRTVSYLWILAILIGCTKPFEENPFMDFDHIIFGKVYRRCEGDCVRLFKLTPWSIYRDREKMISTRRSYRFSTLPLNDQSFFYAQQLPRFIPDLLFATSCDDFGDPGNPAADEVLLIVKINGLERQWTMGGEYQRLPMFLRNCFLEIESILARLP